MYFDGTLDDDKLGLFCTRKLTCKRRLNSRKMPLRRSKTHEKNRYIIIDVQDLPEDQKFKQLSTQSKHLIDTIKMTAYRAETAMANSLRDTQRIPMKAVPYVEHSIKLKRICYLIWKSKH